MVFSKLVDVAKDAGVGVGTVSRVINNDKHVSEKTRQKVLRSIEKLNFIPNQTAVNFRNKKTNIIALMVPKLNNPFFSTFADEVEINLAKNGYSLLVCCTQHHKEQEIKLLNMLKNHRVDGVIVVTHHEHELEIFKGLSLISLDRIISEDIPYVTSENYNGVYDALEFLKKTDAKRIGYLGSKPNIRSEVSKRYDAYCDFVEKNKLENISLYEQIMHGEEKIFAEEFLNKYPDVDAIVASSDTLAQELYSSSLKRGIKVPEELQIIGFDGVLETGLVKISSIKQQVNKLAETIVNSLLNIINLEKVEKVQMFPVEFIEGETTQKVIK